VFCGLALVALVAVCARPSGWFVRGWPQVAAVAADRASSGDASAVWPSDKHADWLLWSRPALRGRIAYDSRFELDTKAQLDAIVRYKSLTNGWERAITPFTVVVVDPHDTPKHLRALRRLGATVVYAGESIAIVRLAVRRR
jgi:hypothetical protein